MKILQNPPWYILLSEYLTYPCKFQDLSNDDKVM